MAIILPKSAIISVMFTDMKILATLSSDTIGKGMFDSKSVAKELLMVFDVACDEYERDDGESVTSTPLNDRKFFF